MDERIKQIADLYGRRHQCIKCLEEMAELSVEIAKYLESGVPDGLQHIPYKLECELADVIIMVEQLKYLTNTAFVEQEIERKLERQMQRIEEASGIWRCSSGKKKETETSVEETYGTDKRTATGDLVSQDAGLCVYGALSGPEHERTVRGCEAVAEES